MKTVHSSSLEKPRRRRRIADSVFLSVSALLIVCQAAAGELVYDTPAELLGSGDFNGDGLTDAVILDKLTGNARVGYQDSSGALSWSGPVPTGLANVESLAVGKFLKTDRDSIAVSSLEANRIYLADLSTPTTPSAPLILNPTHPGITLLVGLEAPYAATNAPGQGPDWLVTGAQHDPGITLLDLLAFTADGLSAFQDQIAADGRLESASAFRRSATDATLIAAMRRGTNDTFVAYAYTNTTQPVLTQPGLPSGSEYLFGLFNGESLACALFYVPGSSNVTVQRLVATPAGVNFGPPTVTSFGAAVERIYVIHQTDGDVGVVQFGDGAVGVRSASDSNELQVTYGLVLGAKGNIVNGVLPLGSGRFVALVGSSNQGVSTTAQVFASSGSNYVQTSSATLAPVSSGGTRANVWLFSAEPFVSAQPGFVASLHAGDWVMTASGLPGGISVVSEADGGAATGLGPPVSENLGAAPGGAAYALVNQYHPAISLFAYTGPRPPEPVRIAINPAPGKYDQPVAISFSKGNPTDHVYFRVGNSSAYDEFVAPFTLSSNAAVQFYGTADANPQRSTLQTAKYEFPDTSFPLLVTTNGTGTNGVPPVITPTNGIPTYIYGTVIYGRAGNTPSIWAINYDGSGDHFITEGARPRLSPDGRYLAFLRGGSPLDPYNENQGSIWVRDLLTGTEGLVVNQTGRITGYDWGYGADPTLYFDEGCGLWATSLDAAAVPLPLPTDCSDDAPAVNPADGRIAFHNLGPTVPGGLFITDPSATTKQPLDLAGLLPRWPSWSPDGEQLAFSHYQFGRFPQSGEDLYVVRPDGTGLHQITAFRAIEGFANGAVWSPNADALVGAATVGGVNGIWIVPLSPNRDDCGGDPIRLPTAAGDPIDFVGNVFVPPAPPGLFITLAPNEIIVWWPKTVWPYVLETLVEPANGADWTAVSGPFTLVNNVFEYHIPAGSLKNSAMFRLSKP